MIFLAGATVNAQNLSLGPTAGFGHSWSNVDIGSADRLFHPSYNVGAKLVYSFVSNWGISADLKFSSEGTSIGENMDNSIRVRSNYIRIPLQGIYFFGQYGNAVRPKVALGPSLGFLAGGQITAYDDGEKIGDSKTKDYIKTFDIGLQASAGANFRLAPTVWLNTDIGYYHGFLDAYKGSSNDFKNRNIGVNVGVTFGIGTIKAK